MFYNTCNFTKNRPHALSGQIIEWKHELEIQSWILILFLNIGVDTIIGVSS